MSVHLEMMFSMLPEDVLRKIENDATDLARFEHHKKQMKKVHVDLVDEYNYLREENILHEYLNLSDTYDDAVCVCNNEGLNPLYDNESFTALQRLVDFHKKHTEDLFSIAKRYNHTRIGDMMHSAILNVEDYYDTYFRSSLY